MLPKLVKQFKKSPMLVGISFLQSHYICTVPDRVSGPLRDGHLFRDGRGSWVSVHGSTWVSNPFKSQFTVGSGLSGDKEKLPDHNLSP